MSSRFSISADDDWKKFGLLHVDYITLRYSELALESVVMEAYCRPTLLNLVIYYYNSISLIDCVFLLDTEESHG